MATRARVALVIPAWNEPDAIGAVLDEVPRHALDDVIVVVGSGSDPTAAVARDRGARVLVQLQPGYGAACWTGAEVALEDAADVIAFLDGDYSDPPAELPRVLQPILDSRADLVLGCRNLHAFPDALPPHARLGNALILTVVRGLLGIKLRDLPSFKAIRADALHQLQMREMTYGWTVEMLVKAARIGLRLEELDVVYRPRLGGRSKVAGSLTGSVRAATKLVACAVGYATNPRWSAASGQ
jgi:glycosyltransferase involved in cell wall biosynthesis